MDISVDYAGGVVKMKALTPEGVRTISKMLEEVGIKNPNQSNNIVSFELRTVQVIWSESERS